MVCCGCVSRSARANDTSLHARIAKEFAEASPLAEPGDAQARDAAAAKLVECRDFRTAVGEKVIWGGFDSTKGYDPKSYLLTELEPLVWLKLYASTLMFTGEHQVRTEGPFTVLDMKAKFRSIQR